MASQSQLPTVSGESERAGEKGSTQVNQVGGHLNKGVPRAVASPSSRHQWESVWPPHMSLEKDFLGDW